MGMDPEAMLYYGIAYGEDELTEEGHDSHDPDRERLEGAAVPRPKSEDRRGADWDDWRRRRSEWQKEQIGMSYRGSGDCESPFVFVERSMIKVEWDESADVASLEVDPTWDDKLRDYCSRLGFPYRQPGWKLAARYS